MKPSDSGVSSLVLDTLGVSNGNTVVTAIRSLSDEVFVKINGQQHYLWRAVDQDGEVVDVYLQARRDGPAAKRFFKKLMQSYGGEPRKIVTDKLRSAGVAHRELMPDVIHSTEQYANSRAEQSHESTRVRERGMRNLQLSSTVRSRLQNKTMS
jgi:transposase-like protein